MKRYNGTVDVQFFLARSFEIGGRRRLLDCWPIFFFFCRKYYVDVQLDDMPKNAEMARSNRFELICKRRLFIRDSYSIYITCLTYIDK